MQLTRGKILRLATPLLAVSVVVTAAVVREDHATPNLQREASVLGVSVDRPVLAASSNPNKPVPPPVAADPKNFTISGQVTGLWPGVTGATLVLTAQNPNNFPIVINSLTAAATSVTPSSCPLVLGVGNNARATVRATPFSGSLRVEANSSVQRSLPITMDAASPDACSGADFRLTYGGQATKANQ